MNEFDLKAKDWDMNLVHIERSKAIADLYLEDGSFHDGDMSVHFGFDPEKLAETLHLQGFSKSTITPCFMMRKVISAEKTKEYPIFLLTAVKP